MLFKIAVTIALPGILTALSAVLIGVSFNMSIDTMRPLVGFGFILAAVGLTLGIASLLWEMWRS